MLTPSGVTFSTPIIFIFKSVRNITTPIPSLKSDSPAILVSVTGDRFIFFTIERTAIGSVGAISAPNNKQSTYVKPSSFSPNMGCSINQKTPEPTANVENTTPKLAKNNMVTLSFNNS